MTFSNLAGAGIFQICVIALLSLNWLIPRNFIDVGHVTLAWWKYFSAKSPIFTSSPSTHISESPATHSPAEVDPLPDVYRPLWAIFETYRRSWDLAIPGSPIKKMWMSPRSFIPPSIGTLGHEASWRAIASLTSSMPYISGAIDLTIWGIKIPCSPSAWKDPISSFVRGLSSKAFVSVSTLMHLR